MCSYFPSYWSGAPTGHTFCESWEQLLVSHCAPPARTKPDTCWVCMYLWQVSDSDHSSSQPQVPDCLWQGSFRPVASREALRGRPVSSPLFLSHTAATSSLALCSGPSSDTVYKSRRETHLVLRNKPSTKGKYRTQDGAQDDNS